MKKMIFALVAMFVMTMSASAQSDNKQQMTFEKLSNYLELRTDQIEPVKTAMTQLTSAMEALYRIEDTSKGVEAWQKIEDRHMKTMQGILSEKQYKKYNKTFRQTAQNTAERVMNGTQPRK